MLIRRWAHAIVGRYPQAWRERYEAEVRGIIDDRPLRFRDLGDLIRGLFTETARELLTSEEKPRRTARVVWLATPILGGLFVGVAGLTGVGLVMLTGAWSDRTGYVALALVVLLTVTIFYLTIRGRKRREPGRRFAYPPDVAVRILPLVFVAMVLYGAAIASTDPSPTASIPGWIGWSYQWVWFSFFAGSQIASFFPGKELLQTLAKVDYAESQIRTNEQWVAGCNEMISKGVPSPLSDALKQVGKWEVERDSARARLKDLGYRARFRGPIGHPDGPETTI
jgi:uncharacterized membrane protein